MGNARPERISNMGETAGIRVCVGRLREARGRAAGASISGREFGWGCLGVDLDEVCVTGKTVCVFGRPVRGLSPCLTRLAGQSPIKSGRFVSWDFLVLCRMDSVSDVAALAMLSCHSFVACCSRFHAILLCRKICTWYFVRSWDDCPWDLDRVVSF